MPKTTAADVFAAYRSLTPQQQHAFFVEVSREPMFPESVRKSAAEVAREITREQFDARIAELHQQ